MRKNTELSLLQIELSSGQSLYIEFDNENGLVSARKLFMYLNKDWKDWEEWHTCNILNNLDVLHGKDWVRYSLIDENGQDIDKKEFGLSPNFAITLAKAHFEKKKLGTKALSYEMEKTYSY